MWNKLWLIFLKREIRNDWENIHALPTWEWEAGYDPDLIADFPFTYKILFSSPFNFECRENPYIKATYEISNIIIQRIRFFPYHFDTIFDISPMGRRFKKQCQIVHEKAESTIRERRKELARTESFRQTGRKYLDFLDILIEAKVSWKTGV